MSRNVVFEEPYDYERNFWNMIRNTYPAGAKMEAGRVKNTDTYRLPENSQGAFDKALMKESLFRNLCTVFKAHNGDFRIFAKDCEDLALFVKEGDSIPIYDGMRDFTIKNVDSYKLATFVKLAEEFVNDASFNIEEHLRKRFAKNVNRAEEKAFVAGGGIVEPTGILSDTEGAEVGTTVAEITFDSVIDLFFSVKPEYRRNGVWLVNDETALALRKLKDADGNYIWNHSNDTILGKRVYISEHMPGIESGKKPIAFGDFSYYWIIERRPFSVRTLTESFAALSQIGYLGIEFIEGKLIRPEAIKVLQIGSEKA